MAYNKEQVAEAYRLANIQRNDLTDAQQRLFDKIVSLLITKCNQQNIPLSSMSQAFREIRAILDEDPLLSPSSPAP